MGVTGHLVIRKKLKIVVSVCVVLVYEEIQGFEKLAFFAVFALFFATFYD